jgi:hypothetical protein
MIAAGSDVNAPEPYGTTPLIWAANRNDTDLVSRLLRAGAKPNGTNLQGTNALAEAAFNANTVMMRDLLTAGADANAPGADGQTPSCWWRALPTVPQPGSCWTTAPTSMPAKRNAGRLRSCGRPPQPRRP